MADFSNMTSEEIAGYMWDVQKAQIGPGSGYEGDAGRKKFISDYSGQFKEWGGQKQQYIDELDPEAGAQDLTYPSAWEYQEDTAYQQASEKTEYEFQEEQAGIATGLAEEDYLGWKEGEESAIETEAKRWREDDTDDFTSSAELRKQHFEQTTDLNKEIKKDRIKRLSADYAQTRESVIFEQTRTGIRDPKGLKVLKEKLWSSVERVKDDFSDDKKNRQKKVDREIVDNRRNIIKSTEKLSGQSTQKELGLEHFKKNTTNELLFQKEEAVGQFGSTLYSTMRRIMSTGIFDAEITPVAATVTDTGDRGWTLDSDNNPSLFCVVSTTLNATGAWSDSQKEDAVQWCQDTHHDGTERGKTWIKGYHIWGKFVAKWVKRNSVIRYLWDLGGEAFLDVTYRNKANYLGYILQYGWMNPLSYIIGTVQKRKVLGVVIIPIVMAIYTILFPLFSIISIPYMIKRRKI